MPSLGSAQYGVFLVLGVLSFAVQIWALVDCLRQRSDAFPAAGKMTKQRWMIILAVAVAIGFISFTGNALGFLNLIAFVAAAVYHVDVKPALKQVTGGGRGGSKGASGPW